MIQDRIEKLRFIAEEMQIAFHLAANLADPFFSRTIARHILVRAENLISHARRLRRPLRDSGFDTAAFHTTKEAYATEFEEYFKVARHKIGAHVQDFDFGKRIELWNDIEIVKLSYFVDGAQEIYECLAALTVPGYVPYAVPAELSDPKIVEILHQFQRSLDARTWIEMGVDSLAMARDNTSAVLNVTPIHARAGQLALIRRWIALQLELRGRLTAYPATARLFKERIVTDIVSFCDCLVTRPVAADALQAMDGLNKLVQAENQSSAAIDGFVSASHFDADLAATRRVRDKIGAHLEIDEAETLPMLLAELDAFDLDKALAFYARVAAAFNKQCSAVIFLRMYAADGARLYGVTMGHSAMKPFAGVAEPTLSAPPAVPLIDDEQEYAKNLTRWLDGDESQKGTARDFFSKAFMGSECIEDIKETENLGSGARFHTHQFRKAHQFFLDALNDGLSDFDLKGVLDLVMSCRGGAPYPLSEVLVRYAPHATVFRQYLICRALGEIGSGPHESVSDFLDAQAHSPTWVVSFEAKMARYKSFIMNEGVFRANHKGKTKAEHDTLVASMTQAMSPDKLLILLLGFASVHTGPLAGVFTTPFRSNYTALQAKLEMLILPLLNDDAANSKAAILKQLIQTHDYVGVSVHIAINLNGGESHPLYAELVDACCRQTIIAASNNQAIRHLAMTYVLKKDHLLAFEIAGPLADRNPDWIEVQILVAQILGEIVGAEAEARERVSSIRSAYKLSAIQEAALTTVETEVQSRRTSQEE
ncbi:hypothetical protein [Stenotrophomonas sp. TWI1183]|uniref:hypothetical protein n=1 Tax=Stenotrophomonas sp. TWI1183 TaxID=3136799 RepID=UPI003208ABC5